MLSFAYSSDLDRSLANELIYFRFFIRPHRLNMASLKLLNTMLNCGLHSKFPNVYRSLDYI